jgi:AcrR family transcriptional regulator
MSMPRLSRQESRRLTRQKLIEAAEKEIIRVGIYKASIRQICAAAGFTLGAFYSNFRNRDELLLEVVNIQTDKEIDVLKTNTASTFNLKGKEIISIFANWVRDTQKNKILSDHSLELEVYASHNPDFKKQYNKIKKQWHVELAKALEALFAGQGLSPKIPVMQMAVGLSALWSGFAIEGIDPDADAADKIIPVFLEALMESSRQVRS